MEAPLGGPGDFEQEPKLWECVAAIVGAAPSRPEAWGDDAADSGTGREIAADLPAAGSIRSALRQTWTQP